MKFCETQTWNTIWALHYWDSLDPRAKNLIVLHSGVFLLGMIGGPRNEVWKLCGNLLLQNLQRLIINAYHLVI
jgi:hypothetical protein